jgi:hypothetical protein
MKDELKNDIKKVLESKSFRVIIYIFGGLAVAFLIFQMGMFAGFRKATFGRDWGDNYAMNFGLPNRGPQMMGGDFSNLPNAHGAIGKIIKIELPTIIVSDEKDKTEKVIIINDKTEIRMARDVVTTNELKLDDHIVVIGSPDSSGQIEAMLIRLLPAPLPEPIKTN